MILSGGGTAGHIYPALALAHRLITSSDEVLYVGTPDSLEQKLACDAGIAFVALDVRPLESDYTIWRGPDRAHYSTLITAPLSWLRARRPALRIIDTFHPDVVIGFGGYVCAPIVWAAARRAVPIVLHEQNSVMGKANAQLAKQATSVALTFDTAREQAERSTDGQVITTGNPVRPEMLATSREQARAQLGLDEDDVFVLVFGGSRGARNLNKGFAAIARKLLEDPRVRLMHATGPRDHAQIAEMLGNREELGDRYHLVDYIDRMDTIMPAADLVISRAGSTSIAEIAALAIPSILVPFPHATGDHQRKNARALTEVGAAVMLDDDDLDTPLFGKTVTDLIADQNTREEMSRRSRSLATQDALSALEHVARTSAQAGRAKIGER